MKRVVGAVVLALGAGFGVGGVYEASQVVQHEEAIEEATAHSDYARLDQEHQQLRNDLGLTMGGTFLCGALACGGIVMIDDTRRY